MLALISEKECIGCGVCLGSCNYKAISLDKFAEIDGQKCFGCGTCVSYCAFGAISLV